MDTKKKQYLTGGALIAIIIGVLVALNSSTPQTVTPVPVTTASSTQTEITATTTSSASIPAAPTAKTQVAATEIAPAATVQIPNVTLAVPGNSYSTYAPAGSVVLDMMRSLDSTSDFTFDGREYPSLGFFVNSINGKKAENAHNWILYINGKLSNTGASQTTLKAGDAVEWKYEKSY